MKVGMVLEGGALRTIFSTGVLDAMLEKDLMTDYVVGVSAGIAYGVSYVSRQPRRNLEILTRFANDRRYMGLGNLLDRHNRSYFGLEFSYETIPNELVPFDYDTFAAFPGKVEAGVTNLETGKAEYLEVPRRDDSFLLLQATCAMPLMFPVYRLGGKPYLDGGAAETVPYPRAFEMGCDRAIVILTKPRSFVRKREKLLPVIERRYREYPNFCQTMRERAERDNRAREELFRLEKEGKVLVLAPEDLRSAALTAQWEDRLARIAKGQERDAKFVEEMRAYASRLVAAVKASDAKYTHDNQTRKTCPDCGKFLLLVKGKRGEMLVCPDRECGYRKSVTQVTNARCPNCFKKMELRGEGENQMFACVCGYREKLSAFQERRKSAGAGKRDVAKYLQQQKDDKPVNSGMADALAKWLEKNQK